MAGKGFVVRPEYAADLPSAERQGKVIGITGRQIRTGLHFSRKQWRRGEPMNGNCAKCGTHVDAAWAFCPHCAAPIEHQQQAAIPHQHEHAPVKGGYSGLLFGLVAAPVLIIYGGMICLTGLGVFLGVPMIIAGIFAPLLGPFLGLNALKGTCPWCGAAVGSVALFDRFSCPACSKRIVVRKQEMLRVE